MQQLSKAYQQDALEARILGAMPAELVEMLYAAAVQAIGQAEAAIKMGDFEQKSRMLSKGLDIVSHLEATLNHEQGGEVAENLSTLYRHARARLMQASLHNDIAEFETVASLLDGLRESWAELGRQQRLSAKGAGSSHGAITV
ncbi:flagellar export chaperone FliS [Laribacter hongkongensis]|uniref:flagellar export chaperone FliS n=1 Tax=Laribacter hongkongensis TaxID=168471 RepID=UPI0027E58FC0|nr:flagellar export chaperone FliS [Laribacter hongkongensis]